MTTVLTALKPHLADVGFTRRTPYLYERETHDATHVIALSSHSTARGRHFTFAVGVRHDTIHYLFTGSDGTDDRAATFAMPIHLLTPSRTWIEWPLKSSSPKKSASDAARHFADFGEPYLARMSDLRVVEHAAQSPEWIKSFPFDQTDRLILVASLHAAGGAASAALQTLREELARREGQLPKHITPLLGAIRRIEATAV